MSAHRVIRHYAHTPPPAVDLRTHRGEVRTEGLGPDWRTELLVWSIVAFACLGVLALCGWVITVAGAWA